MKQEMRKGKQSNTKMGLLVKNSNETENQAHEKIINEAELKKRGGIAGDKNHYFITYLRLYYEKSIFHEYADNLIGLAEYIASKKEVYINIQKEYKLMKISSIIDYLHRLSKQVKMEIEQEKEEKKRERMRYKNQKR